jgi:Arc/MetJ family transcription regulator
VRTTLDIDAKLIEEAVRLSGRRTKAAAVEVALREYVRLRRKEILLGLPGRVRLEEDWRALREAELDESGGPTGTG